jgi:hypothetical protein
LQANHEKELLMKELDELKRQQHDMRQLVADKE